MSILRLGKLPPTKDDRDLLFVNYLIPPKLPTPPKVFGHQALIPSHEWEMLGNGPDESVAPGFAGAGDCVFAGGDHETMLWNAEAGNPVQITGLETIQDYSAVTGYVIGDDSTDQGTEIRDALKYRYNTGLLDHAGNRHKIGAYLALEPGNLSNLYTALWLFGTVEIGLNFPSSAMDQFDAGKSWSVVRHSSSLGGHDVCLVGKGSYLYCVTWGRLQAMTVSFFQHYCDEMWAILSPEFLVGGKKSLEGFDLATLQADLTALAD